MRARPAFPANLTRLLHDVEAGRRVLPCWQRRSAFARCRNLRIDGRARVGCHERRQKWTSAWWARGRWAARWPAGWRRPACHVAIVDRAALPPMEHPDFDGRAYAIAAGTRRCWRRRRCGMRCPAALPDRADPRLRRAGRAGRPRRCFLHFDHARGWAPGLSAGWWRREPAHGAERGGCMPGRGVTVRAPAEAPGGARPPERRASCCQPAARDRARLVVAAEGRRQSRCAVPAGIPVTRYPYRQSGIVCAIAHELPHGNGALEHFLPGGPFAQLPLGRAPTARPMSRPSSGRKRRAVAERARPRSAAEPLRARSRAAAGRAIWARSGFWAALDLSALGARSRTATSTRAWPWWAMPRMASTRSRARGSTSACATRSRWPIC